MAKRRSDFRDFPDFPYSLTFTTDIGSLKSVTNLTHLVIFLLWRFNLSCARRLGYKNEYSSEYTKVAIFLLKRMTAVEFADLNQNDKLYFLTLILQRWNTLKTANIRRVIGKALIRLEVVKYLQDVSPPELSTALSVWRYIIAYIPNHFNLVMHYQGITALDITCIWTNACRYAHMAAIRWITERTPAWDINHKLAISDFIKGLQIAVRGTVHSKRNVHQNKYNNVVLYIIKNHPLLAPAIVQANQNHYIDLLEVALSVHHVYLVQHLVQNKVPRVIDCDDLTSLRLYI